MSNTQGSKPFASFVFIFVCVESRINGDNNRVNIESNRQNIDLLILEQSCSPTTSLVVYSRQYSWGTWLMCEALYCCSFISLTGELLMEFLKRKRKGATKSLSTVESIVVNKACEQWVVKCRPVKLWQISPQRGVPVVGNSSQAMRSRTTTILTKKMRSGFSPILSNSRARADI